MLREKYEKIKERLNRINFNDLWEGFHCFNFALYNKEIVVLNDECFPWTSEFCANTSIKWCDEYIAIWQCLDDDEDDIDVLTSKIVHEMFHAYQNEMNENRFSNELEALITYQYSLEYLQIKYQENSLLVSLTEEYSKEKFTEFCLLRQKREKEYPFEYNYERSIETIEGSAQYVEMKALGTLDSNKKEKLLKDLKTETCNIESLIPIRIVSYAIGALVLMICYDNKLDVNLKIDENWYYEDLIHKVEYQEVKIKENKDIKEYITKNEKELKEKIERIINKGPILVGNFELRGLNVYNARYYKGYIYTEYFLCYRDNIVSLEDVFLDGDYVIKIENQIIKEIYKD